MISVLADTITPFITSTFVYLFLLNILIAVLEGLLLRRWFYGRRSAIWWMLPANYLSAWIGWIGLNWLIAPLIGTFLGARPIERINLFAALWIALSFAVSVLVEAGFIHLAIERAKRSAYRTLLASLCVNAVSYVLITLWFFGVSYTLPFNARITSLANIGNLPSGTLYWVDPAGKVIARSLRPSQPPRQIGQVIKNDFVWPYQLRISRSDKSDRTRIDTMYASKQYADRATPANLEPPEPLLLADAGPANSFPRDYWDQERNLRKSTLDLRAPEHRQTRVDFDWYRHDLRTQVPGGKNSELCVGLAMLDWHIQEPTILPDEKIVFEWADQILLFDPRTRELAYIAPGTCPAFVPDTQQ